MRIKTTHKTISPFQQHVMGGTFKGLSTRILYRSKNIVKTMGPAFAIYGYLYY